MNLIKYNINSFLVVLLWFLCCSLLSCTRNVSINMLKPIDSISIGMSREHVEKAINELQVNGVLSESNEVCIKGERVSLDFHYCKACFGYKLDGIVMNFISESKTDTTYDYGTTIDANIKWHIIERSYDFLSKGEPNYALCIYSDNLEYDPKIKSLFCLKQMEDPCW